MKQFSTPMMRQYQEIKSRYQDCLLLYRMGDFYELFLEDAHIGARVLSIALTSKAGGKDGRIPMAGIPYHAVDSYLSKLVKMGYKVAICEQLSPPNKKGLVERDVIRVVTPGTVMDENALEKKTNNYIVSVARNSDAFAISIADVSTGFFATTDIQGQQKETALLDELARLSPSECILSETLYADAELLRLLKQQEYLNIYCFSEWNRYAPDAEKALKRHFRMKTLAAFGLDEHPVCLESSAALLGYLQTTQKATIDHIQKITYYSREQYMVLDKSTMSNLEIFSTIRDRETKGSLLSILDHTATPMGGRLLKEWMKKPLLDKAAITKRHDAVEELLDNRKLSKGLQEELEKIADVERIFSRIAVGLGNARDIITLKNSLQTMLSIKALLTSAKKPLLQSQQHTIAKQLQTLITIIETTILPEPAFDVKGGGIIQNGVDKKLDKLRNIISNSKDWMRQLEKDEREKTGINTLKIRFNQVFGFYIEVTKANADLVPSHYIRKQTLVNGERFITKELKQQEEIILAAEDESKKMEYEIFLDVVSKLLQQTSLVLDSAKAIAVIDCLATFATIAQKYRYVRPTLIYSGEIKIVQGRHPVVEQLLSEEDQFVPNDVTLNNINQSLILLTGPNMAGKSVFIRQIAHIVYLCQIGCFVPAKSAHLSLVDKIFVRSGASDMITSGLSTFMVEMVETAYILHNATNKSLIVMDEIGRGTSTYDGISIAWAVAEYLVTHFKSPPKTLFATHYHELHALEDAYPHAIKNFHMSVSEDNDNPIFLHTITKGEASHSFGVAVAKLAGIPQEVIQKAQQMLASFETTQQHTTPHALPQQKEQSALQDNSSVNDFAAHVLQKEIEAIDIARLTPLEALNVLAKIKDELRLITEQSVRLLEKD